MTFVIFAYSGLRWATTQERYQRAAEQAQRANGAGQVRTYGNELRQLEGQLKSATVELGRLDAQQRAIRYDLAGIAAYRRETKRLQGSFATIAHGSGKLQTQATELRPRARRGLA